LLYDATIRADTMCRTLAHFSHQRAVDAQIEQSADQGRTYFVIHPILKHIALLSLGEN
jgi:methionyl-tRNA formyltransferase